MLWFKNVRQTVWLLWCITVVIKNIGMWLRRFVIVITSCIGITCRRPGACTNPTVWDWATYIGTIGICSCSSSSCIRFCRWISIFEMRRAGSKEQKDEESGHGIRNESRSRRPCRWAPAWKRATRAGNG